MNQVLEDSVDLNCGKDGNSQNLMQLSKSLQKWPLYKNQPLAFFVAKNVYCYYYISCN